MLGKAQNFSKIHIKTAHSQLPSLCTALFSLICSFSTPFLPRWAGEANKQNHCLHRLKEKLTFTVLCQEGRTEWQSSYPKADKQSFLCGEISGSQAGVKAEILASFPVPCAARLLLTPNPTFRRLLPHITDVLQVHGTLLSCPRTQDKF